MQGTAHGRKTQARVWAGQKASRQSTPRPSRRGPGTLPARPRMGPPTMGACRTHGKKRRRRRSSSSRQAGGRAGGQRRAAAEGRRGGGRAEAPGAHLGGCDVGQAHPRVARGGLHQDGAVGRDEALLLRPLHHGQRDAVLDCAGVRICKGSWVVRSLTAQEARPRDRRVAARHRGWGTRGQGSVARATTSPSGGSSPAIASRTQGKRGKMATQGHPSPAAQLHAPRLTRPCRLPSPGWRGTGNTLPAPRLTRAARLHELQLAHDIGVAHLVHLVQPHLHRGLEHRQGERQAAQG